MIDLETLHETSRGTTFDRLTALLIGLIAVMAAALAVVQMASSQAEGRANTMSSRTTTDVASHLTAVGIQEDFQLTSIQRALQIAMEGTAREIVALDTGSVAEGAKGEADVQAATRLQAIASHMGSTPDQGGPVDAYAQRLLAMPMSEIAALVDVQGAFVDAANTASDRSSRAVLGLALLALAGVLVGLASVLGDGRAGRLTLAVAFGAVTGAGIALALTFI